uniref:Spy0128 family protein n=1 Tax=Gemmiger sp. TaxID=2049027 RepID=UPI003A8CB8C4
LTYKDLDHDNSDAAPTAYTYTVSEVKGDAEGVSYDDQTYTFTVEVQDDGTGKMKAALTKVPASMTFTNTYTPKATPAPTPTVTPSQEPSAAPAPTATPGTHSYPRTYRNPEARCYRNTCPDDAYSADVGHIPAGAADRYSGYQRRRGCPADRGQKAQKVILS